MLPRAGGTPIAIRFFLDSTNERQIGCDHCSCQLINVVFVVVVVVGNTSQNKVITFYPSQLFPRLFVGGGGVKRQGRLIVFLSVVAALVRGAPAVVLVPFVLAILAVGDVASAFRGVVAGVCTAEWDRCHPEKVPFMLTLLPGVEARLLLLRHRNRRHLGLFCAPRGWSPGSVHWHLGSLTLLHGWRVPGIFLDAGFLRS